MKILYDYQAFEQYKIGGISRYFFELINYYQTNNVLEIKLPIEFSSNVYIEKSPFFNQQIKGGSDYYHDFLTSYNFKGKNRLYELRNNVFPNCSPNRNKSKSIEFIKKGDFDLFHPTDYDDYFLDYIGNKPYVITVYDMIHEIFPEFFSLDNPTVTRKKKLIENAEKIIAISESTKQDLINIYNVSEKKIEVIYLATSMTAIPEIDNQEIKKKIPRRYILFVGSRRGYKNFYFFIQSIVSLLKKDKTLYLVTTGVDFNLSEISFLKRLGLLDRITNCFVDDETLSLLYQNALAFVFPSQYEGFGLPVLESFACGCPTILSNTSSLREVGGDAAVYIDPKNALSILEAIEKVIYNNKLREDMKIRGFEQLRKFSWEDTSRKTQKLYEVIINKA